MLQTTQDQTTLFLSYARADDEPFVRRLYDALTAQGLSIWFDREQMPNRGLTFSESIKRAVLSARRLALIVTPNVPLSDYVSKEWRTALNACIPVIPVLRMGSYADLPPELAKFDTPDFRDDDQFDYWLDYLVRQIVDDVPPLGTVTGLRWFQVPLGYVQRPDLWETLDQAVRGDAISAGVITSREQTSALQGLAGLGKTIIAAAYAESCAVRRTFDDGVHWLTAGRNADALTLLTALGVRFGEDRQHYTDVDIAIERLAALLAEQHALIVIDDVWHKAIVSAFQRILGPECRLLFTTRSPRLVTLTQAQRVHVTPLDTDQGVRVIGRWLGRDMPDDSSAAHAASERAIIALLDGHTLAVTLAAARIAELGAESVPFVLSEYQRAQSDHNPFADLELDPDDKNWNVERSLRLSYEALNADNQRRFRQLGVIADRASFTGAIAAAIWQDEQARSALNQLEAAALIETEADGSANQHSVLRAYAAALLHRENASEEPFWRYVAFIADGAAQFDSLPRDQLGQLDPLHPHIDYLGEVLCDRRDAASVPDDTLTERLLDFAGKSASYVVYHPQLVESEDGTRLRGMRWLEAGLKAAQQVNNSERAAYFANAIGYAWNNRGEHDRALAYYEQALILRRETQDRSGEAIVLNNMAATYSTLGDQQKSLDIYSESLALRRALDDRDGEALTLANIAASLDMMGKKQEAIEYNEQSLRIYDTLDDPTMRANSLNNLGKLHDDLRQHDKAADYYAQSLAIYETVGDAIHEANLLINMGTNFHYRQEMQQAITYYERAQHILKITGNRVSEGAVLNNLGALHRDLGELETALTYYEQALPLRRAVGDLPGEAVTCYGMGKVYHMLGDLDQAIAYITRCVEIEARISDPALEEDRAYLEALKQERDQGEA